MKERKKRMGRFIFGARKIQNHDSKCGNHNRENVKLLKRTISAKASVGGKMMERKYALVIIDMQNDFVMPGSPACVAGAHSTVPVIKRLLDFFRLNKLSVFHVVREYRADGSDIEMNRLDGFLRKDRYLVPGTKGCEIVDPLRPMEGEYRIVKNRYSGFMNTELDFMLRRIGVTHLVVCGTQYPNCIRATIFDAVCYGYPVINIIDATSAQTPDIAKANIVDIRNIGVDCIFLDEFIHSFHKGESRTGNG